MKPFCDSGEFFVSFLRKKRKKQRTTYNNQKLSIISKMLSSSPLPQHPIIRHKKATTNQNKQHTSKDKTQIQIKEPSHNQCRHNQQTIIEDTQVTFGCTFSNRPQGNEKE